MHDVFSPFTTRTRLKISLWHPCPAYTASRLNLSPNGISRRDSPFARKETYVSSFVRDGKEETKEAIDKNRSKTFALAGKHFNFKQFSAKF